MDYVLTYADRGFSGNPYAAGMDRTYSLDALPQEYPSIGTGDYRNIALNIKNEKGVESADLLFKSYEIRSGKYQLQGLPAVWADKDKYDRIEQCLPVSDSHSNFFRNSKIHAGTGICSKIHKHQQRQCKSHHNYGQDHSSQPYPKILFLIHSLNKFFHLFFSFLFKVTYF